MPSTTPLLNLSNPVTISGLKPYSKYEGFQQNGSQRYKVSVIILTLDLKSSLLSGYLFIEGLTSKFPSLTTFFEGEIVDRKFTFETKKW